MQGHKAEAGVPRKSGHRGPCRGQGSRTRPGSVGWREGWVGEKRQPENRQRLSRDSGKDDYAAIRWRLLRPLSAHLYPSPGPWTQAGRPQSKSHPHPRLPAISRFIHPIHLLWGEAPASRAGFSPFSTHSNIQSFHTAGGMTLPGPWA